MKQHGTMPLGACAFKAWPLSTWHNSSLRIALAPLWVTLSHSSRFVRISLSLYMHVSSSWVPVPLLTDVLSWLRIDDIVFMQVRDASSFGTDLIQGLVTELSLSRLVVRYNESSAPLLTRQNWFIYPVSNQSARLKFSSPFQSRRPVVSSQ